MHVLVTGGCGFIGSHVVEALVGAGHRVRVLDDLSTSTRAHLPLGTELQVGDVADQVAVARALAGVDAVCHQAAKVGLGRGVSDLADYVRRNDLGTAALLSAMSEAGILRLVLASSMVVYGEGGLCLLQAWADPTGGAKRAGSRAGPFRAGAARNVRGL